MIISTHTPQNHQGLTLLELLATLAIISIIATISIPSLTTLHRKHVLHTHTNQIVFDLYLARSEAIKTATETTLCKSGDLLTCDNDREWHEGWIIFSDNNQNKQFDKDELLIRQRAASHSTITIKYRGFRGPNRISYSPTGYPATFNGSFTISNTSRENKVIISRAGRVRTTNGT